MTITPGTPSPGTPSPDRNNRRDDELDILITRITDQVASDHDWQAFADLAHDEPSAWKALAQAQRDQAALGLAVNLRLHAADAIELDDLHAHSQMSRDPHRHRRIGWSRFGAAAGWAVAACVGLAWLGSLNIFRPTLVSPSPVQSAGLLSVSTAEDAARAYVQLGKAQNVVLGELPQRVIVESRPRQDGKIEVVYIRQFVERAASDSLVGFAVDEAGRPVPVRIPMPNRETSRE